MPESVLDSDGIKLVTGLMAASAASNFNTMDALYTREKEQRQALEVHIQDVLDYFAEIALGTVREYETGVKMLERSMWIGGMTDKEREALLARHPDNHMR